MGNRLLALALLALSPLLFAQQEMNNAAVIKLLKAGLSDDLIVTTIDASPGKYDTSADALTALRNAGVECDIIRIPNGTHGTGAWHTIPGVPDWERQMTEWLNKKLVHEGRVGEGIRQRQPKASQMQ